jgi:hypothetical protein
VKNYNKNIYICIQIIAYKWADFGFRRYKRIRNGDVRLRTIVPFSKTIAYENEW